MARARAARPRRAPARRMAARPGRARAPPNRQPALRARVRRARPDRVPARRRAPARRAPPRRARRLPAASSPAIERSLASLDHEEVLVRRGRRSGLFTFVAVHSTVRGPALGGCRMWAYDDARAALRDVLRLSGAMTMKSSAAGLPLGGGKGVIMLPDGERITARGRAHGLRAFGA